MQLSLCKDLQNLSVTVSTRCISPENEITTSFKIAEDSAKLAKVSISIGLN